VWEYVERQDLSVLYRRVQTTRTSSGRPAIDPAILMALWLYATLDGVGSARLLDRLCRSDIAYRWLVGGVSVNYHTLSDFRTSAGPFLDQLLSHSMAVLIASGLVEAETLAVDGMRLRASAGSSSFRTDAGLAELRRTAAEKVDELRRDLEADPDAAWSRRQARRAAAARDRQERLERALEAHREIAEKRQEEDREQRRKTAKKRKPARASTTDPQARIMKMGHGGLQPAYNVQFVTTARDAHIIGVRVTNRASDRGQLIPALDEIKRRYGLQPRRVLADRGFDAKKDIEKLHGEQIEVFCPPQGSTDETQPPPQRRDGEGVLAWRRRMATPEGQAIYKGRFATERPHGHMRTHGLHRVLVRGIDKVAAVVLWHVHAFNFLQFRRLRLA
jgi:transposase